jgi:hypothetical protein
MRQSIPVSACAVKFKSGVTQSLVDRRMLQFCHYECWMDGRE